jgi:mono/diheme cytochrome c family protein
MFSRVLLILCILPSAALFATDAANPQGAEFFDKNIRPILSDNCFKCHSHAADKIKGGLLLDSREAALTGGDTGPAVIPGNLEKSLLIEAIGYANSDLQMPPKKGTGKKLSDEQIELLTEWVKMGAPWGSADVAPAKGQKMTTRAKGGITAEDRKWWSFQPIAKPAVPEVAGDAWSVNEIDRFVFQKLAANGFKPAPPAAPEALVRRMYFDVTGLPPSPEEVRDFVQAAAADRPAAISALVEKLLASPHYGEQWGRHWLDLVRYAESDGYKIDEYRPDSWRYRDYVIQALNRDKPYDRFLQEQLAGDELFPGNLEALVATGYLRHGIYEYNNRDVVGQWTNMLNDITDVTGDVFLGLGIQCARCHDHKFDPILQKDYYRLQAFFAPLTMPGSSTLATPQQEADYKAGLNSWEDKTADVRAQIAAIEEPAKQRAAESAIKKFPPETQAMLRKTPSERTPWEQQIATIAFRQVLYEWDHLVNHMRGPDKEKIVALQRQLAAFDKEKPSPLPTVLCGMDVGSKAPLVTIPKKANLGPIEPGFLTILDEKPADIEPVKPDSTGRRAALARWLTKPSNPLTARVMVNRVWQYHFGKGLAPSTSDFGRLGELPSHPELLDWLARSFTEEGWSLKKLHRMILLSATYQQSAANPMEQAASVKDPENRLLWRANTRRLDAEQIRDSILSIAGELQPQAGGPSMDSNAARRAIYTKVMRNTHDPVLEIFDAPEGFSSTPQRNVTTTPTQSLFMINSAWSLRRAEAFARRLERESSADEVRRVADAFQLAFGRAPTDAETRGALKFIDHQAQLAPPPKADLEIAPFNSEKMPLRDGRAAVLTPGAAIDRLTVPDHAGLPDADFTIEGFVLMKSVYEDAQVRTIAAQWDGSPAHPGWAFGVTGKKSRYKPQTLVLQLRGDQPWSEKDPVEPLFSGLHVEVGKPYYVAVSVKLGETGEGGITFYAKDLSNDDEPLQVASMAHHVTSGIRSHSPFLIGARGNGGGSLFDGLIDDVRISNVALPSEQLILNNAAVSEHTTGYWKFENDPGVYKDSSAYGGDIVGKLIAAPSVDSRAAAWVDFCQALINANEFLYID